MGLENQGCAIRLNKNLSIKSNNFRVRVILQLSQVLLCATSKAIGACDRKPPVGHRRLAAGVTLLAEQALFFQFAFH